MPQSLPWLRWALLVSLCIACGRSRGGSAASDGTGGRPVASGGSLPSSAGNAGNSGESAGGSTSWGAAGEPESGGAGVSGAGGGSVAGSNALGGAAGEFSMGGSATSGESSGGTETDGGAPGTTLEPVRVIRGGSDAYWDLIIQGEGLDEYNGTRVLVRVGNPDRPPERLGSGEALIDDGAFQLVFSAVWETNLYKTKLALIDVDGDRACDLSVDRLFGDSRASFTDVLFLSPERMTGGTYLVEPDAAVAQYYCDDWFNREWPRE